MKDSTYIHKIVLKVIDELKEKFSQHYHMEFIAFANDTKDGPKYITVFSELKKRKKTPLLTAYVMI